MCGCSKGGAGSGGGFAVSRTRFQVVSPGGTRVTYATREEAMRHQQLRGGSVQEIKPGM